MNFNFKKWWKETYFYETKASMSFIPMRRMSLQCPIMKKWRLLCEPVFVLTGKLTLTLEKDRKRSFSYKTKASISFIPVTRISLWSLIMNRKEIIMWIHACPNSQTNFNSKRGGKRSISYETKPSMSFILMSRTSLWCLIMKRKEITI